VPIDNREFNMSDQPVNPQRRLFLQASFAAAAAATLTPTGNKAAEPEGNSTPAHPAIPTRSFGKTGRTLPLLGMGGSAMVDKWASAYGVKLAPVADRAAMVRYAYDQGIRYFDTARVYSESESIMGQGLKGVRDQVFLATKVAVFNPTQTRQSVEESLKQLDTNYVDLVQVHSPAIEALGFAGAMKIHAELVKLRDQKLLRFIGLTTHVAFETVHRMIATAGFDQVLLAYGYFNKGMDTLLSHRNLEWRELCLAKAHELGMAIVAMKVMGASVFGHNAKNLVPDHEPKALERLPGAAIRWVLRDARVSMLNIGVSMRSDIDRNLATLSANLAFTNDDHLLLADFARRAYDADGIKKMKTVRGPHIQGNEWLC
jgi:aryl-alcohol dehydrogenase-like predicted oxidoreductase